MKKILCAVIAASTIMLLSVSVGNATTYTYEGSAFTQFPPIGGGNVCAVGGCGNYLTASVTFNFDTSSTSGVFNLSSGDITSAYIQATPYQGYFGEYPTLSGFPSLNGFVELVAGVITDWSLVGGSAEGEFPVNFSISTTTSGDGIEISGPGFGGSASNSIGGIWAELPTTPLPAALPLFVGGLAVMGLLARHRKRKAGPEKPRFDHETTKPSSTLGQRC
jgi:hypothetical protein